MVINDKLKGEFYRAPITKLSSRRNVSNTINELIDYYNNIAVNLDKCFDTITENRDVMIQNLYKIHEKTIHFQYILNHFNLEVDQHISEKLNMAINSFQTKMTSLVTSYDSNLFNHRSATDQTIAAGVNTSTTEEWDRSINSIPTDLGIRWFGGKIENRQLINELNGILRLTKINTYDGKKNEEYINSNLILEIFIYTKNGIIWLELGQNATFEYNMIMRYKSKKLKINLDLNSETYNASQNFDLNTFDFDMIIDTLLDQNDLEKGNVYIKVKTNIPSNTESGKEGYFLSSSYNEHDIKRAYNDYEYKQTLKNFSTGLLYEDNKDVAYVKQNDSNIDAIESKNFPKIETPLLVSPESDKFKDIQYSTEENTFNTKINISDNSFNQQVFNPDNEVMENLMDIVSGYVISNSEVTQSRKYFENKVKFNKKYENDDLIYTKGETLINLKDQKNIGPISLIAKNETSFALERMTNDKTVVPNEYKYGTEASERSIYNRITNDSHFEMLAASDYIEKTENVFCNPANVAGSSKILAMCKINEFEFLISKTDGLYLFHVNSKLDGKYPAIKVSLNNLANIVYDIILNKDNIPLLATDNGILCYHNNVVELYGTVGTGISTGEWCKLFKIGAAGSEQVVAIRKDFSTTIDENHISYGESMCIENNNTMTLFKHYYNAFPISDPTRYHISSAAIAEELTNNEKELDYETKRYFQNEFNVIHDTINNCYYIFRYGHKLLKSSNNTITIDRTDYYSFSNFAYINAMKDYNITSAVLKDNKIYFTVWEGDNLVYDIVNDKVEKIEYKNIEIVNNRRTAKRIYYVNSLNDLTEDVFGETEDDVIKQYETDIATKESEITDLQREVEAKNTLGQTKFMERKTYESQLIALDYKDAAQEIDSIVSLARDEYLVYDPTLSENSDYTIEGLKNTLNNKTIEELRSELAAHITDVLIVLEAELEDPGTNDERKAEIENNLLPKNYALERAYNKMIEAKETMNENADTLTSFMNTRPPEETDSNKTALQIIESTIARLTELGYDRDIINSNIARVDVELDAIVVNINDLNSRIETKTTEMNAIKAELVSISRTDCFVTEVNNKLFFIPLKFTDVKNIVFCNGFYYVVDVDQYIWKFDENFNAIGAIYYRTFIDDICVIENLLLISTPRFIGTDNECKLYYSAFEDVEENPVKIVNYN